MRFNSDGKFKIMQITDIQEIPDVSPDTIKLINAALEEEKPDLVVLTGDQIKGYGVSYKGKGDALIESVAETSAHGAFITNTTGMKNKTAMPLGHMLK